MAACIFLITQGDCRVAGEQKESFWLGRDPRLAAGLTPIHAQRAGMGIPRANPAGELAGAPGPNPPGQTPGKSARGPIWVKISSTDIFLQSIFQYNSRQGRNLKVTPQQFCIIRHIDGEVAFAAIPFWWISV